MIQSVTVNKKHMAELEENLLYKLNSTEGSLVDDDSLIEVLKITKSTSKDVQDKLVSFCFTTMEYI